VPSAGSRLSATVQNSCGAGRKKLAGLPRVLVTLALGLRPRDKAEHFYFIQRKGDICFGKLLFIDIRSPVKGKFRPITGHEGPEGGRGIALLFL
jgi:hypothetical protein